MFVNLGQKVWNVIQEVPWNIFLKHLKNMEDA